MADEKIEPFSEYKCTVCGQTYTFMITWSDKQAMDEYNQRYGDAPNPEITCDDCYKTVLEFEENERLSENGRR